MKNILLFLFEHREAIGTFLSAIFLRRLEKKQVIKKTAEEIHTNLISGKSIYESLNKFLK